MSSTVSRSLVLSLAALLSGCGGSEGFEVAPVSGQVTLDDQPLPNATVTFMPVGTAENPGPPSAGTTDEEGRYTLKTRDGDTGAVVGPHTVMVTTIQEQDEGTDDYQGRAPEKVPAQYNTSTTLTFDVPADGSTEADFPLESK